MKKSLKTRRETIREILKIRGKKGQNQLSWDKVAEHFGVSKPCVYRLVHESNYNPGPHNSQILGMEYEVKIPACPNCGEGHYVDFCTKVYGEPKKPRVNSKSRKPRPPTTIYVGVMTPEEKDLIMEKKPEERKKILLNEGFDDQEDSEPFPEVPEERLEKAMRGWIE